MHTHKISELILRVSVNINPCKPATSGVLSLSAHNCDLGFGIETLDFVGTFE